MRRRIPGEQSIIVGLSAPRAGGVPSVENSMETSRRTGAGCYSRRAFSRVFRPSCTSVALRDILVGSFRRELRRSKNSRVPMFTAGEPQLARVPRRHRCAPACAAPPSRTCTRNEPLRRLVSRWRDLQFKRTAVPRETDEGEARARARRTRTGPSVADPSRTSGEEKLRAASDGL